MIKLDHLVVAASTVEHGVDFFNRVYGLRLSEGGKHLTMGTHNAVMKLDGDRYLEIIAIDVDGLKPNRARWFNLDSAQLQAQLMEKPRLISWVARTDDFEMLKERAGLDIGKARAMRRGDISWRFGFSDDGSLFENGILPHIIQWDNKEHVSRRMPENDYQLLELELNHPYPNKIKMQLDAMEFEGKISLKKSKTPYLKAVIKTASGTVEIS